MPFESAARRVTRTGQQPDEVLSQLGRLLIDDGAVDQRSLERASRVAAETGGRLDQILTQLGIVSDRSLAQTLARLLGIAVVAVAEYPQQPLFADRLKAKFLRRGRVLPIADNGHSVTLAMADPL